MKKWLLVEAVPGPEPGIAGPLVSNPHVPFSRFVGLRGPEVIELHVDITKAIDACCLVKLGGPVVAKDATAARVMLDAAIPKAAPKPKPAPPAEPPQTKKEGK